MSEYKALIEQLFVQAKAQNIQDMEAYFSEGENFSVNIFKGDIEDYKLANSIGLGFRGFYNGKIGYSYTEKVSKDSINLLIKDVIENAIINDSEDQDVIFKGALKYQEVTTYNKSLDLVSESEKIAFAKEMDKYAYSLDSRVVANQACMFSSGTSNTLLMNNKGLSLQEKSNGAFSYIYLAVAEGNEMSTGFEFVISNDFTKYDPEKMAKKAVDEAIKMLNAKPIKTGEYPILLNNRVSADLLGTISSMFSARAVQKGISMLKGKLGQLVANPCISIIDDPFLINGEATASFDGEGVPTEYKEIIKSGKLTTYLYNLKAAKKDGVKTTGNASRVSYKSTIGIAPTNLYIKKGSKDFSQLVTQISNGLYITELSGMHSGFNTISGDFSLGAKGFLIENGEITRAVNQITVSGNYFTLLTKMNEVGNDLSFSTSGNIGSPSIIIENLAIAGE